jgi:hypothetical protein
MMSFVTAFTNLWTLSDTACVYSFIGVPMAQISLHIFRIAKASGVSRECPQ